MVLFLMACRGIVMLYGLTLMALALRKAAIIWKEAEGLTGMRLVNVLIRDQAIYFMVYVFQAFHVETLQ